MDQTSASTRGMVALTPPASARPSVATPRLDPTMVFIAKVGGVWRPDGSFPDVSSQSASPTAPATANRTDCLSWLSKVPTTISTMNRGLGTLQYQSLSENVQNPLNDIMGGTQDNGTHAYNGQGNGSWFV